MTIDACACTSSGYVKNEKLIYATFSLLCNVDDVNAKQFIFIRLFLGLKKQEIVCNSNVNIVARVCKGRFAI